MAEINESQLLYQLMNDLTIMNRSSKYSDLEIKVDNTVIKAYKLILRSRNAKLAEILEDDTQTQIKIDCVDPEACKVYIKYLYTGKVSKIKINSELLKVATKFEDENLVEYCENFIHGNFTKFNEKNAKDFMLKQLDFKNNTTGKLN